MATGVGLHGSFCDGYVDQNGNECKVCVDAGSGDGADESSPAPGRPWEGQISSSPPSSKALMGYVIRSQLDSSYDQAFFDRYWWGGGDYTLTPSEFSSMVGAASSRAPTAILGFAQNGNNYIARKYEFYGSGFAGSIGSGWLISDSAGKGVGFYDRYDFNSKPWGVRHPVDEIKTQMVAPFGIIFHATPYDITYGISTPLP